MEIVIVGIGMGNRKLLTHEAEDAIAAADLLIGAQRMLDSVTDSSAKKLEAATPEKIAQALFSQTDTVQRAVVLVSGDAGFYSASKKLVSLLHGVKFSIVPGISSLQYFCARLCTSWDDVTTISLHGREGDCVAAVRKNSKVFALTDKHHSPKTLCALLTEYGFGSCDVAVGMNLSYPDEKIVRGKAEELSAHEFSSPAVLMVWNTAPVSPATHGIPDDAFLRGETPMTKEEIRAISVAKLHLSCGQTLWDVGAGTGSVSIEAARILSHGKVFAVEKDADALTLLAKNKMRFACDNLHITPGTAPDVLAALPAPDAVFIGGSSGSLREILAVAYEKNPAVRIVVNAIALETLCAALTAFSDFAFLNVECIQVSVAKAKQAGTYHMMHGQNPVFILSDGGNR